jgi:hypothetical protein
MITASQTYCTNAGCTFAACSGTPTACSAITDLTMCSSTYQPGCNATTGTCMGTLTPCASIPQAMCSMQYGCSVQ